MNTTRGKRGTLRGTSNRRVNAKHCVFGVCNSDSRHSDSSNYYFLPFTKPCINVKSCRTNPTPQHISLCEMCTKCVRWLKNCNRGDGRFHEIEHITKYKYICSKHFVKQELLQKYPDPLPDEVVMKLNNSTEESSIELGDTNNTLMPAAAETNTRPSTSQSETDRKRPSKRPSEAVSEMDQLNQVHCHCEKRQCTTFSSANVQTTFRWHDVAMLQLEIRELRKENNALKKKLSMYEKRHATVPFAEFTESLRSDDKKCMFYTGMVFVQILALFNFLAPNEANVNYWGKTNMSIKLPRRKKLSFFEEVVLTLVRVRSGLLIHALRYRFNLSEALISQTFTTFIQYMYNKFDVVRPSMFASREVIKKNLPALFSKLKNIRIIIDCAEFFCETPSNFEHQSNLYSSYKAHTTFKVLLGCNPNGSLMFVSDLFEGSISDKQLVIDSKLMDMLDEGDLVLADRGFTIDDLAHAKRVSLNIPPFLKGRAHLTVEEERATKEIASKRIYIEHVVGRLKQYRLLKKILPLKMRDIMSQTVFVCACLLNFQPPILPPRG